MNRKPARSGGYTRGGHRLGPSTSPRGLGVAPGDKAVIRDRITGDPQTGQPARLATSYMPAGLAAEPPSARYVTIRALPRRPARRVQPARSHGSRDRPRRGSFRARCKAERGQIGLPDGQVGGPGDISSSFLYGSRPVIDALSWWGYGTPGAGPAGEPLHAEHLLRAAIQPPTWPPATTSQPAGAPASTTRTTWPKAAATSGHSPPGHPRPRPTSRSPRPSEP
jgi:hypothetical protein